MTKENKNRINYGLKMLALFICAILTIVVCACLWNAAPTANIGAYYIVASILLFICNGGLIFTCLKMAARHYNEVIEQLQDNPKK